MESVSKTQQSVSKIQELEKEISYQTSHLEQGFDFIERKWDIILDKDDWDVIKVIVMKTFLLAQKNQELNEEKLNQAETKMKNEKFWDKMTNELKEEDMTEKVIKSLIKN